MAIGESQVQQVVHSIEQGRLAGLIRISLTIVGVGALALAYLFIEFKGLSAAEGIDQAQIARELAAGRGFSTKCLRPLAIQQIQSVTGRIPASNFPETYHAPLNSMIDAVALEIFPKALQAKITNDSPVFAGDRLIAAVSVVFFLLAVAVTFLIGTMLFDRRVALTACGLVVVADQFWQFALSGLPQMLMLFLFSCTALCLVIAIKAKARQKRPFLIFFPLGICLGLMALTHPATLWLTAGTALFCGIYFRPRVVIGLIPLIICLGIFSIWIVRDYQLTKTPFGVSPYAFLESMPGSDGAWMRQANPDLSEVNPLAIRKHALEELKNQFGLLYILLGGVIVTPLFFVSPSPQVQTNRDRRFQMGDLASVDLCFCRQRRPWHRWKNGRFQPVSYSVRSDNGVVWRGLCTGPLEQTASAIANSSNVVPGRAVRVDRFSCSPGLYSPAALA